MRASTSSVVEVFYDRSGDSVEVLPRFCVDEGLVRVEGSPRMGRGISLIDQMKRKPDSTICFWRSYALGDILLLTPIFNQLKETYPACTILLATASRFIEVFKYWDKVGTADKRTVAHRHYDIGYHLDGIVERDHTGEPWSHKHRLDLYCDFLGIPAPKDPLFSLPYGEDERRWAEELTTGLRLKEKPIVVMQLFGSKPIKSFPPGKVERIARKLSYVYTVILVHSHSGEIDGEAVDLSGKTTVHELAAVIDCADAVVTMDSGVLWVAHATQTPVVALLGPTREPERLSYHRNHRVVNLSKMVGCEPCFERRTRCGGTIDCMIESDEAQIVAEIEDAVRGLTYS